MQIRVYLIVFMVMLVQLETHGMEKIKKFITLKKEESHTRKLMRAVRSSNCQKLQTLLKSPITDLNSIEEKALLHRAAEQSEPTIVALLLTHGMNINAQDEHGNTPLHRALQMEPCHKKIIEFFVTNGARLDVPNNSRQITYLNERIHRYFFDAILRKDYSLVRRYLLQGAPLNTPVPHFAYGYQINPPIYPLECALSSPERSQEMVTFLLDAGAELKVCNMNRILGIRSIVHWPRTKVYTHLATFLPRPLIKKWHTNALPFLACLKKMPALYTDIRYLLCYYYVRSCCFDEQRETIKNITSQISKKGFPFLLGKNFTVEEHVAYYFPHWEEKIKKELSLQRVYRTKKNNSLASIEFTGE